MLQYILQIIAFQVFFLLIYDIALKKETFFNWNRAYLLVSSMLSFVLPFIKIKALQNSIPSQYVINLPEIVIGNQTQASTESVLLDTIVITSKSISYMQWVFYIGLVVSLLLFGLKLVKILSLFYKNPKSNIQGFRVVNLLKSDTAFSFLNYVFIGDAIAKEEAQQIFEHEKVHVTQKHTCDLLYFELLRIVFWFNPLIYIYQNRIAELHEFIADAKAVKHANKAMYYQNLLGQIFGTHKVSFINTFFKQSLIKKRIAMLSKKQSKAILKFKYALLIPVVFGMLVYTSCAQDAVEKEQDLSQYTYTLKISEKEMSNENKEIHDRYEAFLKGNPDYVGWSEIGANNTTMTYSIHSINEAVPEHLSSSTVRFKDGSSYQLFIEWPDAVETKILQSSKEPSEWEDSQVIPFAVIGQVPVYPGCESGSNEDQKQCMSQNISKLVNSNFNAKVADKLGLDGEQKIYVGFKINAQGQVIDVKARAPHPSLAEEAKRVINLLPKMQPGKHRGENVIVAYSLPIIFKIQGDNTAPLSTYYKKQAEKSYDIAQGVPFAVVGEVPVYPGCESGSKQDQKECMTQKVKTFVTSKFNVKLANKLGLVGEQKIYVAFKIDTQGQVIDVKARAPHPGLEKEAERVVKLLPPMKPGQHKGKDVIVTYSLPIVFKVNE